MRFGVAAVVTGLAVGVASACGGGSADNLFQTGVPDASSSGGSGGDAGTFGAGGAGNDGTGGGGGSFGSAGSFGGSGFDSGPPEDSGADAGSFGSGGSDGGEMGSGGSGGDGGGGDGVACGNEHCGPDQQCCVPSSGARHCADLGATCDCSGFGCTTTPVTCDSPSDCPADQFCCINVQYFGGSRITSIRCQATCSPTPPQYVLCEPDGENVCTGNQRCTPALLMNGVYCCGCS